MTSSSRADDLVKVQAELAKFREVRDAVANGSAVARVGMGVLKPGDEEQKQATLSHLDWIIGLLERRVADLITRPATPSG